MKISVSATKMRGGKLPKEAIAYIAVGRIKVEDDIHESNIKKGEKFYLMEFRKKFYLIDVEGKDLYKFEIDDRTHKRLSKKHTSIVAQPDKDASNWEVKLTAKDIYLNNMVNLKNSITVFKNKGVGDNLFYVMYNNGEVDTKDWDLSKLHSFITKNFKKDMLPVGVWNKFVKGLKKFPLIDNKAKAKPERDEKNGIIGKRGLAAIRYMNSKYSHLESGYSEEGIYLKLQEGISPAALKTKIEKLYDSDSKLQELLKATGFDGPKFHSYGIDSIQRSYASLTFT